MTFSDSMPERHFHACLACLARPASGRARHVKTTKKALKINTVRLELPKLGDRG